jgi:hypothetical protein
MCCVIQRELVLRARGVRRTVCTWIGGKTHEFYRLHELFPCIGRFELSVVRNHTLGGQQSFQRCLPPLHAQLRSNSCNMEARTHTYTSTRIQTPTHNKLQMINRYGLRVFTSFSINPANFESELCIVITAASLSNFLVNVEKAASRSSASSLRGRGGQ